MIRQLQIQYLYLKYFYIYNHKFIQNRNLSFIVEVVNISLLLINYDNLSIIKFIIIDRKSHISKTPYMGWDFIEK